MRKNKYPKHRKSPIRHHVKKHTRKNKPVRDYDRGKGSRPKPKIKKRLHRIMKERNDFHAQITYSDYSRESVDVKAKNYIGALDKSLEERKEWKMPVSIYLRRLE